MEENSLKMEWVRISERECLKFTFKGTFVEEEARGGVEKWREAFALRKGEKINLIWECLEMRGYETEARVVWQNALKDMKGQVGSIWLVTTSKLIKLGAMAMKVFAFLDIRIVTSEEEIVFK